MELEKDFKEFIELLNEHKVKYLVIGGYAVNFHGYPRRQHSPQHEYEVKFSN